VLLSDISVTCFNFTSGYTIRSVQANQEGFKLNSTLQLLVYAADDNILDGSIHTITTNTETLVIGSKETGREVNAEKTKCMVRSQHQNAGQNNNIKIGMLAII
jgi:hypothetical protein